MSILKLLLPLAAVGVLSWDAGRDGVALAAAGLLPPPAQACAVAPPPAPSLAAR
jgi:hypothetical protein